MIAETLWLRCEAATLFIPQLDGGSVALIDSKEDQTSPPACRAENEQRHLNLHDFSSHLQPNDQSTKAGSGHT